MCLQRRAHPYRACRCSWRQRTKILPGCSHNFPCLECQRSKDKASLYSSSCWKNITSCLILAHRSSRSSYHKWSIQLWACPFHRPAYEQISHTRPAAASHTRSCSCRLRYRNSVKTFKLGTTEHIEWHLPRICEQNATHPSLNVLREVQGTSRFLEKRQETVHRRLNAVRKRSCVKKYAFPRGVNVLPRRLFHLASLSERSSLARPNGSSVNLSSLFFVGLLVSRNRRGALYAELYEIFEIKCILIIAFGIRKKLTVRSAWTRLCHVINRHLDSLSAPYTCFHRTVPTYFILIIPRVHNVHVGMLYAITLKQVTKS